MGRPIKELTATDEDVAELESALWDKPATPEYVRPIRTWYVHLACGSATEIGAAIAGAFARDPQFVGGTFCHRCKAHFPLAVADGTRQFVWDDGSGVGA